MKILKGILMAALALGLVTGMVFADHTRFTSPEGVTPSKAQEACTGQLIASKYLVNTGEEISLKVISGPAPPDFFQYSVLHDQSVRYAYQGIYDYEIVVDGKEYKTDTARISFSAPGEYEARGSITFWWKADKRDAGLPEEFFKKVTLTGVIRVSDLEQETDPKDSEESTDKEKEEEQEARPALSAMVSHTEDWERNRLQFNAHCEDKGSPLQKRAPQVYWSGEKFMLSAVVEGKAQPGVIRVRIEDSPFATRLIRRGDVWEGELFDKAMIHRWGRDGPEILNFVFSATIDGTYCQDVQQVRVDDLHKYWLMHRKE